MCLTCGGVWNPENYYDECEMFFFLKFASRKGIDDIFESGPWMIRNIPIFLNELTPLTNLMKEDTNKVPVWVMIHEVPMVTYYADALSAIATKTSTPLMLDSYTSTMCIESWGRSSYARAMIVLHTDKDMKQSMVIVFG